MSNVHHETLNAALLAGGVDPSLWPIGINLSYGQTARVVSSGTFITVTRFECGRYETAISYATQCEDIARVI